MGCRFGVGFSGWFGLLRLGALAYWLMLTWLGLVRWSDPWQRSTVGRHFPLVIVRQPLPVAVVLGGFVGTHLGVAG